MSGAGKGAKNFGIGLANSVTDFATGGQVRSMFGVANPLEIQRYSYNSLTEAKFGFGTELGLAFGTLKGGSPFGSGSSSLSVVPEFSVVSARSASSTAFAQTGSYLHRFESGFFYAGKGNEARMNRTGNFLSQKYNDPLVGSEFFPATSNRSAFMNEHWLMMENGGPLKVNEAKNTYNLIFSPGRKLSEF
ncbi:MAG: hypothetical protein ACKVRN_06400 [Pyrinomonadaceae bacterium]